MKFNEGYSTASESPPDMCSVSGALPEFEICQAPQSRRSSSWDDPFDFDSWTFDMPVEVAC